MKPENRTIIFDSATMHLKGAEKGDRNYDTWLERTDTNGSWQILYSREQLRDIWRKAKKLWRDRTRTPMDTEAEAPVAGGTIRSPDEGREELSGNRFIFTSCQNNTLVHEDFWAALNHFAQKKGAQIYVSPFTYNQTGWANHSNGNEIKAGASGGDANKDELWYDERLKAHFLNKNIKVCDGLIFCGELDIIPTAATPLETLRSYTGMNSGIVPHTKVHMLSQATMKHEPAKFMYTTGTVTQRNYIEKKAGQVASFHHTFGALYVEIDDNGTWFCRQLIADDNGVFYDLDRCYGVGYDIPANEMGDTYVTFGDIHIEKADKRAIALSLEMAHHVRAAGVVIHDIIDFTRRNHHNIKDPHFLVEQYYHNPADSVEKGMELAVKFLDVVSRSLPNTTQYIIRSNHDQAFDLWLRNVSAFSDPENAWYWCTANAAKFGAFKAGSSLDMFSWAMYFSAGKLGIDISDAKLLREDDSLVLNQVEQGMHGHLGLNGARGNPKQYRAMGRRANTAHTHSAGIIDGIWTAGTLSQLDLGYNKGPSSWSHSNILTYPSGKRAMITISNGKWRA